MQMMCGLHESEISLEIWLADDICHPERHPECHPECHLQAGTSSTCHLQVCMSSAHHPQVGTSSACHLQACTSSAHCLQAHMSSMHIICRTPHGQHGPELSFYCDRNWLLNGICHKNVELFHFRIM